MWLTCQTVCHKYIMNELDQDCLILSVFLLFVFCFGVVFCTGNNFQQAEHNSSEITLCFPCSLFLITVLILQTICRKCEAEKLAFLDFFAPPNYKAHEVPPTPPKINKQNKCKRCSCTVTVTAQQRQVLLKIAYCFVLST